MSTCIHNLGFLNHMVKIKDQKSDLEMARGPRYENCINKVAQRKTWDPKTVVSRATAFPKVQILHNAS